MAMDGAVIPATENQTVPAEPSKFPRTGTRQAHPTGRHGNVIGSLRTLIYEMTDPLLLSVTKVSTLKVHTSAAPLAAALLTQIVALR